MMVSSGPSTVASMILSLANSGSNSAADAALAMPNNGNINAAMRVKCNMYGLEFIETFGSELKNTSTTEAQTVNDLPRSNC